MPTWSLLPLLLLEKIMRQLETHDLVRLRLVCKSWKAACTEFGGSAVGYIRDQQEMLDICATLPNMSTLSLTNTAASFDLTPLAACSNLVGVALYQKFLSHPRGPAPTLQFGHLPLKLCKLTVSCFNFLTSGLYSTRGSFTGLTSLTLTWRSGDRDPILAMWKLLEDMPRLKVHCPSCYLLFLPSWKLDRDMRALVPMV